MNLASYTRRGAALASSSDKSSEVSLSLNATDFSESDPLNSSLFSLEVSMLCEALSSSELVVP